MTREIIVRPPMNQIYMHIPVDSLPTPPIEDLSCNHITIRAQCTGSAEFATIPPGANIYIYEESLGDYILQNIKTGSMNNPSIINGIECTSPTKSNRFKLELSGYEEVEGMLIITLGDTYPLHIIFDPIATVELGLGFLIPALAAGSILFLLFEENKKKYKKKHKYNKEKYGHHEEDYKHQE